MRLIDADKLEEQYRVLIADAKREQEKINYIKDRQNWIVWDAIIADRYAFLFDVIRAKTKNDDVQTHWVRLRGDDFGCASCGWVVPDLTGGFRFCPGCGKQIDRSKTL